MSLICIANRIAKIRHTNGRFNLSEFKAIENPADQLKYAHSHLQNTGKGSSRAVYTLTSSKVLKIAQPLMGDGTHDAGIAQNKEEVNVFTNPSISSIVARIYDFDPEFKWIISEIVRPLSSDYEFEKLMGIDFDQFKWAVNNIEAGLDIDQNLEDIQIMGYDVNPHTRKALELLYSLNSLNTSLSDLVKLNSWGKSASGNVILLDYGLTHSIHSEFYS